MELNDVGTNQPMGHWGRIMPIIMVITTPKGRCRLTDNSLGSTSIQIDNQEKQCKAIKAFMEEHSND